MEEKEEKEEEAIRSENSKCRLFKRGKGKESESNRVEQETAIK